jgi:hypothetical protein
VGKGVHTGCRRQGGWHSHHQQWIIDGNIGRDPPVHDGHFDLAAGIRDDTETGHFAGRTGRGVDGDKRRHSLSGLVDAFIIADVAAVGGDDADAFATVVRAAPAQGDDQVTSVGLVDFVTFMHIAVGGVGLGAVIDNHVHVAVGFNDLGDLIGDTGVGNAFVRADERLFTAQRFDLVADFLV